MEKSLRYFRYKHVFSQFYKEMDILDKGIHEWEKDDKTPMMSLLQKIGNFEKKEKENKGDGKKSSLPQPALTLKERAIKGQISDAILEEAKWFNLKPLYYRLIFSLVMGNIKEEDKKLLGQDAKFKKILDEVNAQFKNKYNTLK